MNNENIIAVNIPNIISITIMALIGGFVLSMIGVLLRGKGKPAAADEATV